MRTKLKLVLIIALAFLAFPGWAYASVGEINSNSPGAERILLTSDGGLAVYSASGQIMPGFPIWPVGVFEENPVTGDFDSTVGNEIGVVERKANGDYYLHLYSNLGTEISSVILPGFASNTNLVSLYNYTLRKYTVIYSTATGDVKELTLNSGVWSNVLIISGTGVKAFVSTDNVKNKIYYAVNGGSAIKIYQRTTIWNLLNTINVASSINSQVVDDGNGELWYLNNDKLYAYSADGALISGFPATLRIYAFDLIVADLDKNNAGLEVGVKLMDGSLSLYDYQGHLLKDRFIKENFSYWQALSLEKEQGIFTYGVNNNLTIKSGTTVNNTSVLNPVSGPLFTKAINFTSNTVEIDPKLIPPDPITGLVATSTVPLAVNLSWNTYVDTQGDFNRFEIYRSVDPNTLLAELTPIATSTNITMNSYVDNVAVGSYYYIVAVVDNDGNVTISGSGGLGQGGNWLGPVVVQSNFPPVITGLVGQAVYRGVQLNWTTSSDPGVFDYYVEYKKSSDATFKLAKGFVTTTPTAKIGGLTSYGEVYQFRVAAVNSFGTSTWSNIIEVTAEALNIVIFNGDKGIEGWDQGSGTITIADDATHGKVAVLSGNGMNTAYGLYKEFNQQSWGAMDPFISWDMKYSEDFYIFFYLMDTNNNNYYVRYSPTKPSGKYENYAYINLGSGAMNGEWQHVYRNIQSDLNTQFPGVQIRVVYYALFYGSGMIDNMTVWPLSQADLGSVSGLVKDSSGNLLTGAKVTLLPNNLVYTTDATGAYSFPGLTYGSYQLKAEKDTYAFTVQNLTINSTANQNIDISASAVVRPYEIFTGELGTIEGWYTGGIATITLQYENVAQGNVAVLSGNKMSSNYILLNNAKQYWNLPNKYISWDMNFNEEYVIFVVVDTNQGRYFVRYSPRTLNGQSGNYAYIKLDEATRNGTWQTVARDVQADLNTQFPTAVISKVLYLQVSGSGKMDNVKVYKDIQSLGVVNGVVKDAQGNNLAGAKVTLLPNNLVYTTVTPGTFSFASLPYGSYQVKVEKEGYDFAIENVTINSNNPIVLTISASVINRPINVFSGELGTLEGWYTGGIATITLQYEDAVHGNVIKLLGNGLSSNYILMNNAKQNWNLAYNYVSWDQNFSEEYVVFVYVNTNKGNYYIRYSPRTPNGQYTNYAYIKLDANTKNGTWWTITRDIQADLNTQFPDLIINKINYLQVNGSGKFDNVNVWRVQELGSVFGTVKDDLGNLMSGATVTLLSNNTIYTTTASGTYGFASLPYGNYQLSANKSGIKFVNPTSTITINSTSKVNLDFVQAPEVTLINYTFEAPTSSATIVRIDFVGDVTSSTLEVPKLELKDVQVASSTLSVTTTEPMVNNQNFVVVDTATSSTTSISTDTTSSTASTLVSLPSASEVSSSTPQIINPIITNSTSVIVESTSTSTQSLNTESSNQTSTSTLSN